MKRFETKLIEYIPNLRRYAATLTNNSAWHADDLVQDTLERALNKHSLWIRDSNLRAWLFTIMHNLFINRVNQASAHIFENIDDHEDKQSLRIDPTQGYFINQVKQHLENLPIQQKEVIMLVTLEGFSYNEVANILNVPVGTVMSRLHRSREILRKNVFKESNAPFKTSKAIK